MDTVAVLDRIIGDPGLRPILWKNGFSRRRKGVCRFLRTWRRGPAETGINEVYTHQGEVREHLRRSRHVVAV
ncbi:MAG: hypothetical protein LBD55_03960 [Treponema sp.]|nr:hypothetical protein [Treponema sp.]